MKDGLYLKANEKVKIAKKFEAFIKSGMKPSLFTKALYSHLYLNFGFIAHYNREGFYNTRFHNPEGRVKTFDSIINANRWSFIDGNTSNNADLNIELKRIALKYYEAVKKGSVHDRKCVLKHMINDSQEKLLKLEGVL